MLSEFGAPGVENAKVVDLIGVDPASDKVVLTMIERRPWGASDQQFQQIEEKINRYMGYVLDGFLADHYPQYEGKKVQLRLECAEEPHGDADAVRAGGRARRRRSWARVRGGRDAARGLNMNVVLFGATGMVGQGVLIECLDDPGVKRVVSVVRRPTGVTHEKLTEIVHQDFFDYTAIEPSLSRRSTPASSAWASRRSG